MLQLGAISFAAPWVLLALLAIPAIIWLLRVTPPAPRAVPFPAIRLLFGLPQTREEPQRTPLWLLILRGALAALLILGLSAPLYRASLRAGPAHPLLLVVDDGWASADGWAARKRTLIELIEEAGRQSLPVAILLTAPRAPGEGALPLARMSASDARARIDALEPVPWPVDREAAARRLADAPWTDESRVVWLADGLATPGANALQEALSRRGKLTLSIPPPAASPLMIFPAQAGDNTALTLRRARTDIPTQGRIVARAADGRLLAQAAYGFAPNASETTSRLSLPGAVREDVARIEIEGHRSAGSVFLIDEEALRRNVGLVSGGASEESQPLLSDLFYLERALSPFATVTRGTVETLASPDRAVIVLADVGSLTSSAHDRLVAWIAAGGTLVRFAGPHLAEHGDDLVPVPLREGGRTLGGALSWDTPEALGAFDPAGPFAGLATPGDVQVRRQVLAEPVPDLAQRTWARLADGTPLVTAAPRGAGRIVLVHVTANTDWSDLPLSGTFVSMLRRLVQLAHAPGGGMGAAAAGPQMLAPARTLDAFGVLNTPPPTAEPLGSASLLAAEPGPRHPPGLYGPADDARAFNLSRRDLALAPLGAAGAVNDAALTETKTRDLAPAAFALAFLLALADSIAVLILGGGFSLLRARLARLGGAGAALVILGALFGMPEARAQGPGDDVAIAALHSFRLAYVRTGDAQTDALSKAGLEGLTRTLAERTAVEPDEPMGIDLDSDELAFFPLLYWQIAPNEAALDEAATTRLDRFMKTGGTLVIDTADADRDFGGGTVGPRQARLRMILAHLDLPPLEPVPADHVLTKSFYLLRDFPGRYVNGQVWVEAARGGADHDGVASIIVGANDWAGAWARDANGNPLVPLTPGGERQREIAARFGVNLVMYALTGNYKADQVHVPALLERLGQ